MSCALTSDITLGCRDSAGGIKTIYITELENVATGPTANASGVISTFTLSSGKEFFTYNLEKEKADATSNGTYNPDNGSTFYELTINFSIHKMQSTLRQELALLIKNRVLVIVLDRNGKYWLYGKTNGMDATQIQAQSGRAFGDMNGYNIVLSGKEEYDVYEVDSSLISTLTSPA